jgi:hypothetical protein
MLGLIAAALAVGALPAIYRLYMHFSASSRLGSVPRVRDANWLLGNARDETVRGHDGAHEAWAAEYGHVYTYSGILNVCASALCRT